MLFTWLKRSLPTILYGCEKSVFCESDKQKIGLSTLSVICRVTVSGIFSHVAGLNSLDAKLKSSKSIYSFKRKYIKVLLV